MAHPLYFVETEHSGIGRWFIELDRDTNSRDNVIRMIRSGEVVIKVLEIVEDEGSCRDVTAELVEASQQEHEPASLEAIGNKLAALRDHFHDLRKHEAV